MFRPHKHRLCTEICGRVGRSAESKSLNQHFITWFYTATYQCKVYSSSTGTKSYDFTLATHKVFKVILKRTYVRSQGYHPVSIKSLFYIFFFNTLLAHVSKAEINCLFRNIIHCLIFYLILSITLQGTPYALQLSGISLTTTLPAPIKQFLPTRTPCIMVVPTPIHEHSPIYTSPLIVHPGAICT